MDREMRVIYDHIVDNGVSITDVVASLFIYLTRWYEIGNISNKKMVTHCGSDRVAKMSGRHL